MALTLTDRQGEILRCIDDFTRAKGYPPTARELSDVCHLGGPSGAHRMLETLRRKGFLDRADGSSRSLVVKMPRLDCSSLDPGDIARLHTVAGLHRMFSDLNLTMAIKSDSPRDRSDLIEEALARTSRTRVLIDSLAQSELNALDVSDHLSPLQTVLDQRGDDEWQDFTVDQWVFNNVMTSMSAGVAANDVARNAILWPDIRIAQASADAAGSRLRELVKGDALRAGNCARRAKAVAIGIAAMLASLDAAYGRGDFSVTFDPSRLEEYAPLSA